MMGSKVTPGERNDPGAPSPPETQPRWLTVEAPDVRAFWRPIVRWSLAAVVVPFLVTNAQMALAFSFVNAANGEPFAFLGGTSGFSGAIVGAVCMARLPLSWSMRAVLGLAYFTVAVIALSFYSIGLLMLIHAP